MAKSASRSVKKSLIFATSDSDCNSSILASRNGIDLRFGAKFFWDDIFSKFRKIKKGGQKGGHLWMSNSAHAPKLPKIIKFYINLNIWDVPTLPPLFECPPFLHPNLIRQNVMIKREAYLSKRFKFITYGFDLDCFILCFRNVGKN